YGFGADEGGGAGSGFITGVGHHQRTLRPRERQYRLVQGSAGTGIDPHIARLDAFLFGQELLHPVGFAIPVAASRASLQGPSGFSLALRSTASGGALTLESCASAGSLTSEERRVGKEWRS